MTVPVGPFWVSGIRWPPLAIIALVLDRCLIAVVCIDSMWFSSRCGLSLPFAYLAACIMALAQREAVACRQVYIRLPMCGWGLPRLYEGTVMNPNDAAVGPPSVLIDYFNVCCCTIVPILT